LLLLLSSLLFFMTIDRLIRHRSINHDFVAKFSNETFPHFTAAPSNCEHFAGLPFWYLKIPNLPNLPFLKLFFLEIMIWPFDHFLPFLMLKKIVPFRGLFWKNLSITSQFLWKSQKNESVFQQILSKVCSLFGCLNF